MNTNLDPILIIVAHSEFEGGVGFFITCEAELSSIDPSALSKFEIWNGHSEIPEQDYDYLACTLDELEQLSIAQFAGEAKLQVFTKIFALDLDSCS